MSLLSIGSGVPVHTAPGGTEYCDTDTTFLYKNLNGGTTWLCLSAISAGSLAAAKLDGVDQFFNVGDAALISPGDTEFTILGFAMLADKDSSQALWFKSAAAGNQRELKIWYNQPNDRLEWEVDSDGTGTVFGFVKADFFGSPPVGVWMHVAAIHDSVNNELRLSINLGDWNITSYSAGVNNGTADLNLGAGENGTAFFLNGGLQGWGMYSNIASGADIADHYFNGRSQLFADLLAATKTNLSPYYQLNEATGQQRDDSVGTLDLGDNNNVLAGDGVALDPIILSGNMTNTSTVDGQAVDDALETLEANKGKVLQVLQVVKTDTTTIASKTWADITGMSLSITPNNTANKINISFCLHAASSTDNASPMFRILRDSTPIGIGDAAGSRERVTAVQTNVQYGLPICAEFLDSPASVSALTYKLQWRRKGTSGTSYLNRSDSDNDNDERPRTISSMTVEEVEG